MTLNNLNEKVSKVKGQFQNLRKKKNLKNK